MGSRKSNIWGESIKLTFQDFQAHIELIWSFIVLLFANVFMYSIGRYQFEPSGVVLTLVSWVRLGCRSRGGIYSRPCCLRRVSIEWSTSPSWVRALYSLEKLPFLVSISALLLFRYCTWSGTLFAVRDRFRANAFIAASYNELHCPDRIFWQLPLMTSCRECLPKLQSCGRSRAGSARYNWSNSALSWRWMYATWVDLPLWISKSGSLSIAYRTDSKHVRCNLWAVCGRSSTMEIWYFQRFARSVVSRNG